MRPNPRSENGRLYHQESDSSEARFYPIVTKIYLYHTVNTKWSRLAMKLSFTEETAEVAYFTVHLLAAAQCFLRACLPVSQNNKKKWTRLFSHLLLYLQHAPMETPSVRGERGANNRQVERRINGPTDRRWVLAPCQRTSMERDTTFPQILRQGYSLAARCLLWLKTLKHLARRTTATGVRGRHFCPELFHLAA